MKFFNYQLGIEITSIVVLIISFLLVYFLMPKLIEIVRYINTMDNPNGRSSHTVKTPNLGGVLFFISIIFSSYLIHYYDFGHTGYSLILGLTILFFVGLKDDLMVLSAQTKLLAQIFAVIFILINPDMYIFNFESIPDLPELTLLLSILVGGFIMIFIINAYNLMDGIDGLAAMLGIVIFFIYGMFFFLLGEHYYSLIAISSIGLLLGFLPHNLSKKDKIFMGDTGSMIVGFLIGLLTIRFLALDYVALEQIHINPNNKILIVLTILFFPVVDVARVIIMRLMNKRGIFSPDRCHMHHILVDKGLTHVAASLTLVLSGFIVFFIIYGLNQYLAFSGLSFIFALLALITFGILLLLDSNSNSRVYRKKFKALFPKRFQRFEFKIRKKVIVTLKQLFYNSLL